jgi:hypothetical protein
MSANPFIPPRASCCGLFWHKARYCGYCGKRLPVEDSPVPVRKACKRRVQRRKVKGALRSIP